MKHNPNEIRVVHVLHSFGTGGMEKGIATLIGNSSEMFEHVVVCLSASGESEKLLPKEAKICALSKPAGNSLLFLMRLARQLKALNPDVVHTRNWGGMDAILAARFAGIGAVIHGEHGWDLGDPEGINQRRVKVRRFLSRWVKEFTCVSKHMERWLLDEVKIRRPVSQIYNGVDTGVFCPGDEGFRIRKELGISEKTFVAGVIGRLDPIKDHLSLFSAFEALRKQRTDARLLVVGDGPARRRLESAAGEGVVFLGNRLDVPEILRSVDVFVLPSLNEGISNTILEAMAAGVAVVATRVGGNPELVEDGQTGTLVSARDKEAFASALIRYLDDPGLRRLHGEAGRTRVRNHFSISKMVDGYEAVYRRVVESSRKKKLDGTTPVK
jgi:sugar transferase (PEP-CTERM/EpsH1 system associated)